MQGGAAMTCGQLEQTARWQVRAFLPQFGFVVTLHGGMHGSTQRVVYCAARRSYRGSSTTQEKAEKRTEQKTDGTPEWEESSRK